MRTVLTLRILADNAGVWAQAVASLDTRTRVTEASGDEVIGIVTWDSATKKELAQLVSLRELHSGPIVAVLTSLPGIRGARAVAARVEGSVLAADIPFSLFPTLLAVSVGQTVVPHSIRQIVARPALSPRERQVLAMVVMDFSNAEIARKLVVTESNVKSHLTSAFNKLGVSSRSAAAELILDTESGLGPGILRISPEE